MTIGAPAPRRRDGEHTEVDGEHADVERWYLEYRPALVRLACLVTGSRAVAEEVVQDVFATVVRKRIAPDNPPAYLRVMVLNGARSHLRRRRLERRLPRPDPLTAVDADVLETWSAVSHLPYKLRVVLVLRYAMDLPEADIAALLGCPLGTVKSRLHRGLGVLRHQLGLEDQEGGPR